MVRDPVEACFSNLRELFSAIQARDAVTVPDVPKWAPYHQQLASMIRALQG